MGLVKILSNPLGGGVIAGGKSKETGTVHWASPDTLATNSNGFTGLPGYRYTTGDFLGLTNISYF